MKEVPAPPVVDLAARDFEGEIRQLLHRYVPAPPPARSMGAALVTIAGRMAEQVGERINLAPEKNFVAFLDLLGMSLLPPQPARVPLTFTLAAGAAGGVLVPAGTQVEATKLEGESEAVIFETEADMVATGAELARVFSRDPAADAWAERTGQNAAGIAFPVFEADTPVEHLLFLEVGSALAVSGTKTLVLELDAADRSLPWPRWVEWSALGESGAALPLEVRWEEERWRIVVPRVPDLPAVSLDGKTGVWLQGRLSLPLRRGGVAPRAVLPAPDRQGAVRPFAPVPAGGVASLRVASDFLSMPGARVTLRVELAGDVRFSDDLVLVWEHARAEGGWAELGRSRPGAQRADAGAVQDGTRALTRAGTVTITVPPGVARSTEEGTDALWVRARVESGGYVVGADPVLSRVETGYELAVPPLRGITAWARTRRGGMAPPAAAFNAAPLDLAKDFFPLGEIPRFGDAFHLCLPGIADKPGARVAVDVLLSNPAAESALPAPARPTDDLVLRWEFWSARTGRWETLGESGPGASPAVTPPYDFRDGTEAFASREPGWRRISFTRPDEMGETEVRGVRGAWIRARVAAGAYGHDARWVEEVQTVEYVVPVTQDTAPAKADGGEAKEGEDAAPPAAATGSEVRWKVQTREIPSQRLEPADHRPPSIHRVAVAYRHQGPPRAPSVILRQNDFARQALGASDRDRDGLWVPFAAAPGDPALYLGFTRPSESAPFGNDTVTLYLHAEEPRDEGGVARPRPPSPVVAWDYWNGAGWAALEVIDGTAAFTRRGTVVFLGPPDFSRAPQFGVEAFWLRARLAAGGYPAAPRLRRVVPNTTWAVEGETVRGEVLGSGNGERSLAFRTVRAPVLDAVVEVREPLSPPAAEVAELEAEGGPAPLSPVEESAREVWVRWTRVADFHASGHRSRHYTLDWATGEVRFGDGVHGMIPPTGGSNIRMTRYRTGGGTRGNRPAGNVSQLRATLPYVDAASNPEPAEGGAGGEEMPSLRERGPRWLRHRDRAVAADDYADLAMEASPAVARARAVAPATPEEAGRVRVVVVPRGAEDRPVPTLELLDRVRGHLVERCSPTVDVEVTGPRWLRVDVRAQVAPQTPEAAHGLAARVVARIRAFLHPLTGGPDGQGWEPGRRPYRSELYVVIEGDPDVDHLRSLHLVMTDDLTGERPGPFQVDRLLVYSGTHEVTVASGAED